MCAAPTDPTLISITTEGLKKAGYASPSSDLLTRAQDEFMSEIKSDIWRREKKLKSLYSVDILVLTEGLSRYTRPTAYASDLSLSLMTGTETGTAQSGEVGSVTLASDETVATTFAVGKEILITSGTGKGSFSQITAYNSTTKVATVNPDFTTAPDDTSGYMIIDNYSSLTKTAIRMLDTDNNPTETGEPLEWFPTEDEDSGEITLQPVPDSTTYGLRLRYYTNLTILDISGTLMLLIYRKWRSLWIQGIFYKQLQSDDDNRAQREEDKYFRMLLEVILDEVIDLGAGSFTISPERRV